MLLSLGALVRDYQRQGGLPPLPLILDRALNAPWG